MENFQGKVNITDNSGQAKITLDGNTGEVGIGTSEPEEQLHVVGKRIRLANDGKQLELRTDGSAVDLISETNSIFIRSEGKGQPPYEAANVIINDDIGGNVGIGTNSPNAKLHVSNGHIRASASSVGAGAYTEFVASIEPWRDYTDFSNRELRIQTANDYYQGPPQRGGAFDQFILYNGRISGSLDQPTWHRGVYGRFIAVQFANSGDLRFWADGKDEGTAEEAIIHPIETMRIQRDGTVFIGGITLSGPTGDIILPNADCAEEFDVDEAESLEPGTVMVIGNQEKLCQCVDAYDKRVAGVISGAGDYKPGIVLDRQQSLSVRVPLALLGKVFCKVDASFGPIEVGDLLTTAPTPGHAMKVLDPFKAFGAIVGKALRPLAEGQGLIPILVGRQ